MNYFIDNEFALFNVLLRATNAHIKKFIFHPILFYICNSVLCVWKFTKHYVLHA